MISAFGAVSGVGSGATGARRFCMDDVLALGGIGLAPFEVEALVPAFVGVTSTSDGSTLSSGLRGWKDYELASKKYS